MHPDQIRLTIETHLSRELASKITPEALTQFVVEHLLTDPESGKPMVRYTDPVRKIFQYLDPKENRWVTDTWLYKTLGVIRPLLLERPELEHLVDFISLRRTGLLNALAPLLCFNHRNPK